MLYFLTFGTVLGLSAGLAPGPLLTLVISETIQHDVKSGIKVALAPILTDLPIIILTFFVLSKLSNFHTILGIISLAGGLFILTLGCQSICTKGIEVNIKGTRSRSLIKGIFANLLNPHPYLFWLSVGAPTMTKAISVNVLVLIAFIASFYVSLVGSKIIVAILTGKTRAFLKGRVYIYIMRFLGLALCVLAFVLFYDGLKLLGIIKV
ncbi:MAG TPA: LysE family transporter [Desulfobacteraceae bacterium]|nr:LysE family transporter [Desulfobacteraceae bacterium]HPJ67045.1 LysE family transporter [Desulfobacteraceae bacterium]HPQ27115.1 LysE family transporter [Desulfobacteraceae bacterium]